MKIIYNYVETMFINSPQTAELQQIKEDILANMEDRYRELLAEGKNENEAVGEVIKDFGDIDEILESMNLSNSLNKTQQKKSQIPFPEVSAERVYEYL